MEMYIAHHARCCMGGKGEPFECFFRPGDYITDEETAASDTVRNDLEEAQEIAKIVGESEDVETMTKEHCLPNAWCVAAEKFLTRKYSERGDERKPSKYWIYYYATDAYLQHVL